MNWGQGVILYALFSWVSDGDVKSSFSHVPTCDLPGVMEVTPDVPMSS